MVRKDNAGVWRGPQSIGNRTVGQVRAGARRAQLVALKEKPNAEEQQKSKSSRHATDLSLLQGEWETGVH